VRHLSWPHDREGVTEGTWCEVFGEPDGRDDTQDDPETNPEAEPIAEPRPFEWRRPLY
jgi:hypothetical protein